MGLTSLQVCADTYFSDWLQGTMQEESSSSPSGEMLVCSRSPMMERRLLRPQQEQALKCPRCESTHTKFCYYNNYSLSQPRYFCKTCRRYWTKGGTLRNIPVGGGCRKNKKISSKKPAVQNHVLLPNFTAAGVGTHLSFAGVTDDHLVSPPQPHFNNLLAAANGFGSLDFMDSKLDALSYDFMGDGFGSNHMDPSLCHGFCTPYSMSTAPLNDGGGSASNFNERIMLQYDAGDQNQMNNMEVKPNTKSLSLEWHEHLCSDPGGKDSQGYILNGMGPRTGMINGYGCSTSNLLI